MGLFDFITNQLIEVIDWVDNSTDIVIWKFQDKENNIKNGAKLVVRESQKAVLMNEGEFGDEYHPGTHTLTTANMPILTTLKSWKYGFESPFKVDIYFVSGRHFTNLKWGTSGPILMRDQDFGQVRLRSFGNYSISVKDAKKFITSFAGTSSYVKIYQVEDTVKNMIASRLSEVLAEAKISVMELASNFTEVSAKLTAVFGKELEVYGIQLENFFIEAVSLPEEVEKLIDKKTGLNILKGNLQEFNQMQAGIALEKLSENPGAANMGGMGAGMMLTNVMAQNGPSSNANTGSSKEDLLQLLKQLGELKNSGLLTEEEFNTKKQEILSKI